MTTGVIVWRWEYTLSPDNVQLSVLAKDCIDQLWKKYYWKSVILRTDNIDRSILFRGHTLKHDDWQHVSILKNDQQADRRRFLWFWIRKLYDNGRGPIRLYVDSDSDFRDQVRRGGLNFPISPPHQFEVEKLVTRIRKFREQQTRQMSVDNNYLTTEEETHD